MIRRKDWERRLLAYIESKRHTPFAWVENDCASFANDAVFEMTGERIPIPSASSPQAYARLLRDHGPLRKIATDILGEEIPPAFAQRGDIVILTLDDIETLGVSLGRMIAGPGQEGLALVPRALAVCAWRI
jgi:hypothetical protein